MSRSKQYPATVRIAPMDAAAWKMLANQKFTLYRLIWAINEGIIKLKYPVRCKHDKRGITKEDITELEGLIYFLDHIQDEAEKDGVPSRFLFPTTNRRGS